MAKQTTQVKAEPAKSGSSSTNTCLILLIVGIILLVFGGILLFFVGSFLFRGMMSWSTPETPPINWEDSNITIPDTAPTYRGSDYWYYHYYLPIWRGQK